MVVGIEARGFILGAAVAYELGIGFVPVRKAGKLPGETLHVDYELEYGTAEIEVHADAFVAGAPRARRRRRPGHRRHRRRDLRRCSSGPARKVVAFEVGGSSSASSTGGTGSGPGRPHHGHPLTAHDTPRTAHGPTTVVTPEGT